MEWSLKLLTRTCKRTERCGNPTTLTPSISTAEEVGMDDPFEKKRREARAWVLRAASWKEFIVLLLCNSLDLWICL